MGFRRFLNRLVKPAAMAGTVGILSLGMVVTTPATAEALVKYPKIDVDTKFITGAVKTVAPVAMAAVSVTPVGWGMRLAQLGMLAYSTSDMWIPFVTGTFGAATGGTPGNTSPTNATAKIHPMNITLNTTPYLNGIKFDFRNDSALDRQAFAVVYHLRCKKTDGSFYDEWQAPSYQVGTDSIGYPRSRSGGHYCRTSADTLVGYMAGAANAVLPGLSWPYSPIQDYGGPVNVRSGGDMQQNDGQQGFDPKGDQVGYLGKSECIDSAGTKSWVQGPTIPGDNGAMLMPSCEKAGKGHGTGRTTVTAFKPDGTTETVWDTGAQPLSDPATPLCDPGRTSSGCTLEVTKDGQPCTTGDVECENWAEESKKEDQKARYGCNFGPYRLPASACGLLEKAYTPGGAPLNDENTDGEPSTSSPLGPAGQPAPAPAPVIAPGVNGQPAPGAAGQPGAGAEPEESQCWPSGWGVLNPLEWVYKPVVCAAKALFQPTKSIQARVTGMQGQFSNKVPLSWFGVGATNTGGSSCPVSWAVEWRGERMSLLCGTPAENFIPGMRTMLGGMLTIAMLWPLLRSLFYSAIPVFKVTPS